MAGNALQKQKLLALNDILFQLTDEEHPMTADELVGELEKRGINCERKSVYQDIQALCDYGVDILKTRSKKSGFYMVSRQWEEAEVRLLIDAVTAASFITDSKSRELTHKLNAMLSVWQAKNIDKQVYIDNRIKQKNEEIYYNIDKIQSAISKGVKIEFRYERRRLNDDGTADKLVRNFTISPYALLWQEDRYYCIGNNEKYDNLMHLRLDRMRNVELTERSVRPYQEVSEYKTFFDTADYAKKISNAYHGVIETVEILCKNEYFEQIIDRFGDDITYRHSGSGKFLLRAEMAVSDGLVADLLEFGDEIEVMRPASLREKMKQKISSMAAVYAVSEKDEQP